MKRYLPDLVALFVALIMLLGFITWVNAAEAPADLWKGIMGEAVGEGYEGMYAVCCVYKNRIEAGISLGCVALKRKDLDAFCARQGEKYCRMAREIVAKVFNGGPDVTNGATHYEAIERYGVPYWAKSMVITAKIGEHTFYRELK